MDQTGNTILITGGGSGIGRALAEALHKQGNTVVIAGRRQSALDGVIKANPGIKGVTLDLENAGAIKAFAAKVSADFPDLNVVINNAGIMKPEDLKSGSVDQSTAEATITTNLLGTIRLTTALLPHLLARQKATVMTVSSGLAFVPMAVTPTYCATKAAVHSYTQSLRHQLRETNVEVLELIPPYVQTELMGSHQKADPRAMPLGEFIAEVMTILKSTPPGGEIVVERCKLLRFAAEGGKYGDVFKMLNPMQPT